MVLIITFSSKILFIINHMFALIEVVPRMTIENYLFDSKLIIHFK